MIKLTKRQQEILTLIQTHLEAMGSPPTRAEIAKKMGFKSPNAAEDHLRALARKGVIELVPGTSRGIRLTQTVGGIPIIGSLKAGQPVLTEGNVTGRCKIERNLFELRIDFLVHWTSSNVMDFAILEGDYLAIHKVNVGEEGQTVLIRQNQEWVIKKMTQDLASKNIPIEGIVVGVIRSLTKAFLS